MTFKVFLEQEVRKLTVQNDWTLLRQGIRHLSADLKDDDFVVQYDDSDGDRITVGKEDEFHEMLKELVSTINTHHCFIAIIRH